MDALPSEIIFHILTFLDPLEIVNLQILSRRLHRIARDNNLWRTQCFETSPWEKLRQHRESIQKPILRDLQKAIRNTESGRSQAGRKADAPNLRINKNERSRILANWDPSYADEKINWYSEFIHRSAPITVSWLEQPRKHNSLGRVPMEVRGTGIYNPPGNEETSMAISPLDDGSVCLWDVSGPSDTYGQIIGRSAADILFTSGSSLEAMRSKMINTGVTECVSINADHNRAYIAVQSELIGIDIPTLKVVSQEKFPFSISAISEANHSIPITVGTNLSLHMYDPRTNCLHIASSDAPERLEESVTFSRASTYQSVYNIQPSNYAPLFRPGPLCILHVPTPGYSEQRNNDIYVAGRFPSILKYDRRTFPKLESTIHSGARLCSMTSIPYHFAARMRDHMRRGELSIEQVEAAKHLSGSTIIACGEYNSKGSLELYGVNRPRTLDQFANSLAGNAQSSGFLKNRQTSSNSKLLSVSTHGTRIVYSDGGGNIKWVERDGFTKVREWNISHGSKEGHRGIFGTDDGSLLEPGSGSGDIVRKILHTKPKMGHSQCPVDKDNLVLWTGDKLGVLSFSEAPSFAADSFEVKAKSAEEIMKEREERLYGQNMRRALVRQADEVRFMHGLGLGLE